MWPRNSEFFEVCKLRQAWKMCIVQHAGAESVICCWLGSPYGAFCLKPDCGPSETRRGVDFRDVFLWWAPEGLRAFLLMHFRNPCTWTMRPDTSRQR
jgi:hypothetical protein